MRNVKPQNVKLHPKPTKKNPKSQRATEENIIKKR